MTTTVHEVIVLQPSKGTWGPNCESKTVRDACDARQGGTK